MQLWCDWNLFSSSLHHLKYSSWYFFNISTLFTVLHPFCGQNVKSLTVCPLQGECKLHFTWELNPWMYPRRDLDWLEIQIYKSLQFCTNFNSVYFNFSCDLQKKKVRNKIFHQQIKQTEKQEGASWMLFGVLFQMIDLAVDFPYVREFLTKRDIVHLHYTCPPCLMKKTGDFISADLILIDHYFHDASSTTLLIMRLLECCA